jgi:hypothetical protein
LQLLSDGWLTLHMEDTERARTQGQLDGINARIDAHALNAPPMKAAREVATEYRDGGKEAVERELAERSLPGAAVQGKALVLGLASLARLNRKRLKLENRLDRR